MNGGPLSLESIADDLETPETFSSIIYFLLFKQFLLGHTQCFNLESWKGVLCAMTHPLKSPHQTDLPGGS